jgi:hypothetical protein
MKRAVLLSVFIFLAGATFAQFTIGPKVGFTMSKLKTTNFLEDVTEEVKTGFQFGAFARFGKKLYVQPEIMFVTKGGVLEVSDLGKSTVNLSTFQIPVLVGLKLLNFSVVNLRIMGGPAISFVSNKEVIINEGEDFIKDSDIKDAIWTFQLGGGLDIFMFTLDVRYEWGLNNIWDGTEPGDMKNNLWNISLGWMIL